ncbi:Alb1-domain-containing protein [Dactylonectria estremocensis]|uniref:Alb1-domain-containing protein n=1 Tax=Dactylonectria estremocensis TaxID=1079267 RepID=A0A9P9FES2_9HYPO|nr:Alb1-domain-containing protein [Dactylonectria estremocensis]
MAKKGPSSRSRAARRATSPSIDTDKSLKDVKPPSRAAANARPSVLAVHQSAGVQKKSKGGRKSQLSAKARRRQEKGLEMAEAIIERTYRKVEKSIDRGRGVKQRAKTWEDINKIAEAEEQREKELATKEADGGDGRETDEDMGGANKQTLTAPVVAAPTPADVVPLPMDDDDEIL